MNELIETVIKRDQALKSTGIFGFLTRSLIGGYHNWRANSKLQQYRGNEHFQQILRSYDSSTDKIIRLHRDWYNITTPQIKITQIPKQLIISTQYAPASYNIDENYIHKS